MRRIAALLCAGVVACGADLGGAADAGPTPAVDSGSGSGDVAEDAGAGAGDAYVEPEEPEVDAGPEDAGHEPEPADDAGQEPEDAGPIVIGPRDAGQDETPYFERECPAACPEQPDPERDVTVESNMCYRYAQPELNFCTFYCTKYVAWQDKWVTELGRPSLCAALGGECLYLDADGQRVPGDRELTNESSYCVPRNAIP